MAKITLTWELGGDIGHLARLRPVADRLIERGHSVNFVMRDTSQAKRLLADIPFSQAPTVKTLAGTYPAPATFAEVLHETGCSDASTLSDLIAAWRHVFGLLSPDVVVLDHSPFAYLSLQGLAAKTVILGTGFACPPDIYPLPDLRPWENNYPDRLRMNEDEVLARLNAQLESQGQQALERIGALFHGADDNFLATFKPLDHYQQRSGGQYWGTWSYESGISPSWPDCEGPRIFAYLKSFSGLPDLLQHLIDLGSPVVAYLSGVEPGTISDFQSETLNIVTEPMDIAEVAGNCDLAILNSGHGTSAEMLLAGVPVLELPITVEQYHVAENVVRIGAGLRADIDQSKQIIENLDTMLSQKKYQEAASAFSREYAEHDPQRQLETLVKRIEKLI